MKYEIHVNLVIEGDNLFEANITHEMNEKKGKKCCSTNSLSRRN